MSAARLAKAAIKIPKRIERGPTDILKALASTVKYIPSEPELTLHDDPYLIPYKTADRKYFILSKLSGIKSAKYFLENKPELFFRDDAEPKIEALLPKEQFNPEMKFTEDDLKWCIEHRDPVNGVIAYTSMIENGDELSDETLMQFFEMTCYTNEENLTDSIDFQQKGFLLDFEENLVNQTWKNTGLAHKIFNQTKNLDAPRVYSAMIAGLSKFNEHAKAKQIFDEFNESHPGKALYLEAYNGLLGSIPRLYSSVSSAHEATDNIIKHMENNLVRPDLGIFNSILNCYRVFEVNKETLEKSFQLINDMRSLNIEPSLTSYVLLVGLVYKCRDRIRHKSLVNEMIVQVENMDDGLEIRDLRDANFFKNMMYIIFNYVNDLSYAKRVHQIFMKNRNFFYSQKSRSRYYDSYFKFLVTADNIENIMEFYNNHVPMCYQPTIDAYDALAQAIELYQAPESFVKKVCSDVIQGKIAGKFKNDAVFRKDPDYLEALKRTNTN